MPSPSANLTFNFSLLLAQVICIHPECLPTSLPIFWGPFEILFHPWRHLWSPFHLLNICFFWLYHKALFPACLMALQVICKLLEITGSAQVSFHGLSTPMPTVIRSVNIKISTTTVQFQNYPIAQTSLLEYLGPGSCHPHQTSSCIGFPRCIPSLTLYLVSCFCSSSI